MAPPVNQTSGFNGLQMPDFNINNATKQMAAALYARRIEFEEIPRETAIPNGQNPMPYTLNALNKGLTPVPYMPNRYNPVPNMLNGQGPSAMPYTSSGHNPLPSMPNAQMH